jgi:hypothetical protein
MSAIVFLGKVVLYGMGFIFAVWAVLLYGLLIASIIAELIEKNNNAN